jgi:hypothetical protein
MQDRAQLARIDPAGELGALGAVGAHEEILEASSGPGGGTAALAGHEPDRGARERGQPLACERAIGQAADPDDDSTALDGRQRAELGLAERIEDRIEPGRQRFGFRVVDHGIGAELAHEVDVAGARRGGDVEPEELRDLDREAADPTRACMDQDALAGSRPPLRAAPAAGERGQRDRRGMLERDARRLLRDDNLVGRDVLGEPAHAILLESHVGLVAHETV